MSLNLEYRLLDPWIIEKLKEEERKREEQRPTLPIEDPDYEYAPLPSKNDKKSDRGVYRINTGDDD